MRPASKDTSGVEQQPQTANADIEGAFQCRDRLLEAPALRPGFTRKHQVIIGIVAIAIIGICLGCIIHIHNSQRDRLIEMINQAYQENNYNVARAIITLFRNKYPNDPEISNMSVLFEDIQQKEKMGEAERLRTCTGMWSIQHFVDNFNQITDDKYIAGSAYGTFCNSATCNSSAILVIIIQKIWEYGGIDIKLYEYNDDNLVTSSSRIAYRIQIKDKHGDITYCVGFICETSCDRISLDNANSVKMLDALKRGGKVQIYIEESRINNYLFTIDNCDYLDNAYRLCYGD
jgi:hypothetical protein